MKKYQSVCRTILLSALVSCTGFRDLAAAIRPAYHVTDLGTLSGTISRGYGINASAQVTGESDGHAFLYNGTMNDLGTLGGAISYGLGINDSGQVAGYSYTTGDTVFHAFQYDGTMHDLGTLGGGYSAGHGINASGQVTGDSSTTGDAASHAFLYDGTLNDLGTLGGTNSVGFGINASGQVSGYSQTTGNAAQHAFLYDGTLNNLGTLGGTDSYGLGINDSGQVTGQSNTIGDAAFHAFLYDGTLNDLGTLGGTNSTGYGINDIGQVTGQSDTTGNAASHAFLYTSGSGMVDLNSLIDPLSGWELRDARGINDAGQITGFGLIGGEDHAFLLTPVPEPSTLALVALGAAAFAIRRSRRIASLLCLCCALSVTAAAHAAQYTVTDLGTLDGTYSNGLGINVSGQVTGYSATTGDTAEHATLWAPTTPNGTSGTLHDLGTLGGTYSGGSGINDSGQVAGGSDTTGDTASHATLWTPTTPNGTSGTWHDLGTLGGTYSSGTGINAIGQVAGYSDTTGDSEAHAIMWKPTTPGGASGTMHDLGSLGGPFTIGWDINTSGQVTGGSDTTEIEFYSAHAFLWNPTTLNGASGTMLDLGTLGGTYSVGYGINDSGQVAGFSFTTEGPGHAFLWTPTTPNGDSGTMQDLGTLGGTSSGAGDINDSGQVVGASDIDAEVPYYAHAFLYTSGSGMVDLNTLIDPLSGWELLDASDINDAGQITGQGLINDEYHAFLLTPVQIPGDFNANGVVDAADYTVWRDGLGSIYTQADYAIWKAHFGETSESGSAGASPAHAAAPEPSSLALSALCSLGLLICRRRRRDQ